MNKNKTLLNVFIIQLMQYKDTSQQAFLIIYLICILSFIYFSLGRSLWVSHLKNWSTHTKVWAPCLRLMAEVNRLFKIQNIFFKRRFYIWFWNSSASFCLSRLTLLVSHLSSRDKWNLICDVEVCAGQFFSPSPVRFYSAPTCSRDIFTVCSPAVCLEYIYSRPDRSR